MSERKHKLPKFIIIGAMKAGTTTLYYALTKHSKIQPAVTKELHYFSGRNYESVNAQEYKRKFYKCREDQICGEASPQYLWSHVSPENIKKICPDVKIIALLRNPADRAYSQFHGYLRKCKKLGQKPMTKCFKRFFERTIKPTFNDRKLNYIGKELIKGSCYIEYLRKWYNIFDKKQIMVIKSEDLFNKSREIINQVFEFIGVKPENVKIKHHTRGRSLNKKVLGEKYPSISQSMKKRLMKYYKPYNEELYKFLGRDFEWEKK